jgi:hypothetical protein
MNPIVKRLEKLEQRFPPQTPAPSGPSAVEYIAEFLARNGIVRRETESLIGAFARALGIIPRELHVQLQRPAAGEPAELASDNAKGFK